MQKDKVKSEKAKGKGSALSQKFLLRFVEFSPREGKWQQPKG